MMSNELHKTTDEQASNDARWGGTAGLEVREWADSSHARRDSGEIGRIAGEAAVLRRNFSRS
jgi:hypothetical protein